MSQFKPGDLALIVGGPVTARNIGKTCELFAFLQPGERIDFPHNGFAGVRNDASVAAWLVAGETLISSSGYDGFTIVRPQDLVPLRGDSKPEQQKSREVVE